MRVAILSGKGGTGKTLLSVNLARIAQESVYVDCDVEEPNGLLYYKIPDMEEHTVYTTYPEIDHDQCVQCQKCSDFCKFNALAFILGKVRVFKELCHSCGGCEIICPVNAIHEKEKSLGKIFHGYYGSTEIYTGEMNPGEESGVPIIKELLKKVEQTDKLVFIDAPPGNGCSVMEVVRDADYCILVAEPSIFGLHNLKMVYELANKFEKKIGLVINKKTTDMMIDDFAKTNNLSIISEIPMDLELGKINSNGEFVTDHERYIQPFREILSAIYKEVSK